MFCQPRGSIRPSPLSKALRSVAGVRWWWSLVTDDQVIVFLIRCLCVGEDWPHANPSWCRLGVEQAELSKTAEYRKAFQVLLRSLPLRAYTRGYSGMKMIRNEETTRTHIYSLSRLLIWKRGVWHILNIFAICYIKQRFDLTEPHRHNSVSFHDWPTNF